MLKDLRIVVISSELSVPDPSDTHALNQAARSRNLRIVLLEHGYNLVAVLPPDAFLPERLAQLQPDLIIVDAESEARDALEHVVVATRNAPRPIVMFTNDHDSDNARAAVAAGVSAYIVAGLQPQRIRPILNVALARFEQDQILRQELAQARNDIQELSTEISNRKLIERAKTLLMERQHLSEDAAYARLRKAAMDKNLKIREVAQRMLDVADLLG